MRDGVVARAGGIELHQLEVTDVSVRAFQTCPQALPIGSGESAAPFGTVVAGESRGQALRGDRAGGAHLGCGLGVIGARGLVGPFQTAPIGSDAEPLHG